MKETMTLEKCLFCNQPPGSLEHVFLSALGGRIATRHATCQTCNSNFACATSGKIDDELADQFITLRCGLAIWSGRNAPPPTIPKVGELPGGGEFDLAPGFVPILRTPRVPTDIANGAQSKLVARNGEDIKRIKQILAARGLTADILNSEKVRQRAPMIMLPQKFGGEAGIRSAAKTAVVGACVLYGNIRVNQIVEPRLLELIKNGGQEIFEFAGWDYTNDWPRIDQVQPHPRNPDATPSGFEHTLIIGNVGDSCVAYVEFFGGLKFSVLLCSRSGLQPKGFSINPRALRSERFLPSFNMPQSYRRRYRYVLRDEFEASSKALERAISNVMKKWSEDAHRQYYEDSEEDLQNRLQSAGDDHTLREEIVHKWAEEVAVIELGGSWSEAVDLTDLDNGTAA
jgi:hypothetical protein